MNKVILNKITHDKSQIWLFSYDFFTPLTLNEKSETFMCPSSELTWVTTQGYLILLTYTFLFWIWIEIENNLLYKYSSLLKPNKYYVD